MLSAEFYKLRAHRTPLISAAVLLVGVLVAPAVLLFYTPGNESVYIETWSTVYGLLGLLISVVFGAWLIGTEYKQGTVKRMLTSEPRRLRALGAKATAGAVALAGSLAAIAMIGFGASWLVGDLNNVAVPFEGRALLGSGVIAMLGAAVSFGLATITRNAAFGMVTTLGVLLVLDPLLSLIPTFGDYTLGSVLTVVENAISGSESVFDTASIATSTAVATLAGWLGAISLAATRFFARRDV